MRGLRFRTTTGAALLHAPKTHLLNGQLDCTGSIGLRRHNPIATRAIRWHMRIAQSDNVPAMPKIITVAAAKGGVGKTRLALEIANLLDAPLIDLDWDAGGATRLWGYRHETHVRSPLLDALESGKPPTLLPGHSRRPDLLPGHPDFATRQPEAEQMAALLEKWAAGWGRPYVVVDTHPGAAHAGHGAMLAASVVVMPAVLATAELNALEGALIELADYPLLLVPNRVPRTIPGPELRRLRRLVEVAKVPVGPVVPYCRPLETRKRRAAVTAEDPTPANTRDFVAALRDVADAVRSYVVAVDAA